MQMHFGDGSKFEYFGRGGLRVGDVHTDLWDKLTRYRPNVCLLHLGGNDENSCSFRYASGTHLGRMVVCTITTTVMLFICQIVV